MGKNQTSYHLDDYMPLLELRPRAIFDAAPVKQNIPPEILKQLKDKNKGNVVSILQLYAEKQTVKNEIQDPVKIAAVDLHLYDALSIGKEVISHD